MFSILLERLYKSNGNCRLQCAEINQMSTLVRGLLTHITVMLTINMKPIQWNRNASTLKGCRPISNKPVKNSSHPFNKLYVVQWSLLYKTTATRDHLDYKTTLKCSEGPLYMLMNLSYKTTCLIRPFYAGKMGGLI